MSDGWSERDSIPLNSDPIGDVEDKVIRLKISKNVNPEDFRGLPKIDCCSNSNNHHKVPSFTHMINVCKVCDKKV